MEERKDITAAVRESYLIIIWFIIIVGIRVFWLLSRQMAVLDDFGFLEMAAGADREVTLTSGVAFAYEGALSLIMRFAGNSMEFVAIFQTILQIAALFLLFIGFRQFFGKETALFVGIILGISPWMLNSILQVSPGNFYFFHWSAVFFLIGIFCKRTEDIGWFRSNAGEIYLIITGFYMGVVCVWHYAGLMLIPFVLYALIKNAPSLQERILVRQNILDMEEIMADDEDDDSWDEPWEEEAEENDVVVDSREYMPTFSQSGVITMGMLFGAYCTLMKYTGVTGNFIKGQIVWWLGLYRIPVAGGLWQDMPLSLLLWLLGTILLGIVFAVIVNLIYRRRKLAAEILEAEAYLKESKNADIRKKNETEPEPVDDIVEELDEKPVKKVQLIENPLPVPKRQVRPKVEFDVEDQNDDFDFDVDVNIDDDFDI